MKGIILAGGRGDRLWPLSRKNYPKQFIQIHKTHSLFQEAVARNIPFCDEFIIVANKEYQFIVENQMNVFQGITYRCIYEEVGRKTTAAIATACMGLPSLETVFVIPTDHLIEGENYRDSILRARELCGQGFLVTLGMPVEKPDIRFGYIRHDGEEVLEFVEKPDQQSAVRYQRDGSYLINAGMFLFDVGSLIRELRLYSPEIYQCCSKAYRMAKEWRNGLVLTADVMESIPAVPIEKAVFEKTARARVVPGYFKWKDIGKLEDLEDTSLELVNRENQILHQCENTDIYNQCGRRIVVANGLLDTVVVNTDDAVYIGKKGSSDELKAIMEESGGLRQYFNRGRVVYRKWGTYEILAREKEYVVRKVIVNPGKTIYAHKHMQRTEHWSIVAGTARITVRGKDRLYRMNDVVEIPSGAVHQLSNVGSVSLILIETSVGEEVREEDLVSVASRDVTETDLGFEVDPFVRLSPAYKDFIWGGTRLKERYGKSCGYGIIAESWELSAHKSGQSIVVDGRHKGMLFGEYLEVIGKKYWGWKCRPFVRFPIMIKLIDAREKLSVQVHPDDDFAMEQENEYGKNEMWYIVECDENACLYCGFRRNVTRPEVEKSLREGTILELLNKIPVKRGEAYFIPAGTVHAIGAGMVVCEIQQSSDCTYRLYDYGRTDQYGNSRELHIEKALEVLSYERYMPQRLEDSLRQEEGCAVRTIGSCKYFECVLYRIRERGVITLGEESFASVICIEGSGHISVEKDRKDYHADFTAGESIFLPAEKKICTVTGKCSLIVTTI